ncbi:MAG: hypothetical protein ACREFI_18330 [Stellaceae bacterium]
MSFLSLRSRANPDEVRPGEIFRRRQQTQLVETATVVGLREDLLGIPHVQFKVAIECSDANCFEDNSRILAVEAFLEAYPEHILSEAAA